MAVKISFVLSKIKSALRKTHVLPAAFKLVWKTAPLYTFLWILTLISKMLIPLAALFLTKLTVDSLVVSISPSTTWEDAKPVLGYVAFAALIWVISIVSDLVNQYVVVGQSELVKDKVTSMLQEKSSSLDLAFFDRADYFDELFRAQVYCRHRPVAALHSFGEALKSLATFIALGVILIPYGYWLPLVLLLATIPTLFLMFQQKLLDYEFIKDTAEDERKAEYFHWMLTQRETAQELRLFNLPDTFMREFQEIRTALRTRKMKLTLRENFVKLGTTICTLIATISALGIMVYRASRGLITLGDLAFIYRSFAEGQAIIGSMSSNVSQLYTSVMFLGDLEKFLDLTPSLPVVSSPLQPALDTPPEICFSDVSFSYPSSERKVFEKFNLTLPKGKFSAIVGPNGMGKTTLLKLICRFYDPDEGQITFDGRDLKEMDAKDIWNDTGVLFQEPVKYNATVRENILYGNIDLKTENMVFGNNDSKSPKGLSDSEESGSNQEEGHLNPVQKAALAAGADTIIEKLPEGYETILGREFCKGTDMSTGEWQRVALARAFLANNPILLLDEPTSSMDAWTERDWIQKFRELSKGKTSVVITHRFSTAMYADKIFVVDNGRIIEEGTHEELMSSKTSYSSTLKPLLESMETEQNPDKEQSSGA